MLKIPYMGRVHELSEQEARTLVRLETFGEQLPLPAEVRQVGQKQVFIELVRLALPQAA